MSGWIGSSGNWPVRVRRAWVFAGILGAFALFGPVGSRAGDGGKPDEDRRAQGRELFEREWLSGDSRTHGGDGLGPVYNDSSCIACHNLGGTGGGGPASKNVDIITASPNNTMMPMPAGGSGRGEPGFLGRALGSLVGLDDPADPKAAGGRTPPRR
jgi:mono/diheme cytochrome c family protein